ncbi:carbamoyl phosphate synthase large subunit [Desulfobacter hydrogenophilus]|uniref:Carbamoyl phosphate synthase large chain n=1 Tax=Desulfobacter hydrogenophilus TaxID=2291 RepID=A0A328F6R6_9BACT|nr:carbamoyl-phosphate synthase large subunit [Desulfobacter hydrogenophilus]NDY74174.1 carbamoyl-phosphate synthase large subunit [Desulfobacter hydrogenophilus]QBH12598.1 carbamoyl-phosphate synthase large subunit [Desulfobacter hydrogenophilus]RAM00241.1 carbamoyl phosphate synthase large subunit [Desulfobacter hydrogenophilus]
MPKRNDIHKILIIGAGPIIISQACEFDYSGTQACKALKEEGFEVVLINSNPATIMTDPETADRVYIEPVTAETLCKIIEKERPDAVLPTLGGQTALNTTIDAAKTGIFERYNIELIGASIDAINKAEDRELFRDAMNKIGLRIPKSGFATNMQEVEETAQRIGFPIIVRPSFTLGGTGGGVAYNMEELANLSKAGLDASLITQVMLEESVLGWKEYELEVMRDHADNVVIICSIENIDAMGVHTGDSITVAPAQTLSDKEYQALRDASIAIIREIGVDTGGSNVQFAVNPDNGDIIVVEMNPRVSRSSALASKATGFPIAKIAAKLAVGYTLDEIPNDITGETMACFEPSIDYCVVKIPRWTFEKFPETEDVLTTAMKSVGETMAIGRTFKEALQKGLRSLEIGRAGFGADGKDPAPGSVAGTDLEYKLSTPNSQRIFYIKYAIEHGMPITMIHELTDIDPWFLYQMKQIVDLEKQLKLAGMNLPKDLFEKAKKYGFSDMQLAYLSGGLTDKQIERKRKDLGIIPVYKLVDTCAAEFRAVTPYYYSTYESECEARVSDRKKVIILGGGPNRIGQGIEFDYCCVHASFALREEGVESIMVNSNPETVSTDYDTSDKLYFEPLTREDVLHIVEKEKPFGVIVQFGGQTPLNLATDLQKAGVPIIGTSPESIDRAEDRDLFAAMLKKLNLRQPDNGIAYSYAEAVAVARDIGYPVMVRPSFVLGGRAMKIVYDEKDLEEYFNLAVQASPDKPVLIDKFLEEAFELDVDAISDGEDTVIGGMMEHIEEAGIHSGDSACVLPPYSIEAHHIKEMSDAAKAIAKELNVKGLMNIQFGIMNDTVYIIEVNPRASRTIPFVSKAIGVPLAKLATKVMLGKTLKELGVTKEIIPPYYCVKEAVMPFDRFENVDPVLGPEMKSTGEVMGIDKDLGAAVAKAQFAAGQKLPKEGTVFISVQDKDKKAALPVAQLFHDMGFTIMATRGTVTFLEENKIPSTFVKKVSAGRPHVVDAVKNSEIQLILNTGASSQTQRDGYEIRRAAIKYKIPYATTTDGARAISLAIQAMKKENLTVKPLQHYHQEN